MDELFRMSLQVVMLALLPFTAAVVIAHTAGAVLTRMFRLEADALLYGLRLGAFVAAAYIFLPALYQSLQRLFQLAFEQGALPL